MARTSAVGVLVGEVEDGSATIEWFVSQSARAAAATEQSVGVPYGHAVLLHGEARRHMHSAVFGLLETLGYECEWNGNLTVRVKEKRNQEPVTLAADVQRIVAEQGHLRALAEATAAARGTVADEPGDNERLEQPEQAHDRSVGTNGPFT